MNDENTGTSFFNTMGGVALAGDVPRRKLEISSLGQRGQKGQEGCGFPRELETGKIFTVISFP